MASSIQTPFAQRTAKQKNSLRCILGSENGSAGGKFSAFEQDYGPSRKDRNSACTGPMIKGDHYKVKFDASGADQIKVRHCIDLNAGRHQQNCDDPFQFRLTSKPTQNGKVMSPYEPGKSDNHYAIQYKSKPEIMQCSVEFMRSEHFEVEARVVNWDNQDMTKLREDHSNGAYTATLKGLPYNLVVTSSGGLGTPLKFKYGTTAPADIGSYFAWNSDSKGAGAGVDGRDASRFCKVVDGSVQYNPNDKTYSLGLKGEAPPKIIKTLKKQKTELTKCWFPCFKVKVI